MLTAATKAMRDDRRVAAELEADAGAHHAPAQADRPARQRVARRDDPAQAGARLLEVAVAVEHVAGQVVDQGQVLVVDVAVLDLADQHERRLLGVGLVAHRQLGEGDVDLGVARAELPRQRLHRRRDVGRAGARGEQQLADPETEVQGQVELACFQHGRHAWQPAGRQAHVCHLRSPGDAVRVVMTKWGDRPHWEFDATYLGSDEHGDWIGIAGRHAR